MTNAMIILWESVKLMQDGIIGGSGVKAKVQGKDGDEVEIEIPEQIHTFQAWKSLGYSVKKGEHAIAKFPIWKYTAGKKNAEAKDDEQENGNMFMKVSHFFKASQVEPIRVRT